MSVQSSCRSSLLSRDSYSACAGSYPVSNGSCCIDEAVMVLSCAAAAAKSGHGEASGCGCEKDTAAAAPSPEIWH